MCAVAAHNSCRHDSDYRAGIAMNAGRPVLLRAYVPMENEATLVLLLIEKDAKAATSRIITVGHLPDHQSGLRETADHPGKAILVAGAVIWVRDFLCKRGRGRLSRRTARLTATPNGTGAKDELPRSG